jgi:hypothetical protein
MLETLTYATRAGARSQSLHMGDRHCTSFYNTLASYVRVIVFLWYWVILFVLVPGTIFMNLQVKQWIDRCFLNVFQ